MRQQIQYYQNKFEIIIASEQMQQLFGDKIKAEYEIQKNSIFKPQIQLSYHEQQQLYDERPSRDEDREQIKQLQKDVQDRDYQIMKLNQQMIILKQGLSNREKEDPNFIVQQNKGFNLIDDYKSQQIKKMKFQRKFTNQIKKQQKEIPDQIKCPMLFLNLMNLTNNKKPPSPKIKRRT
ncbi:hypothetical protein pb186bvf_011604 [Paramecium bursaria]